MHLARWWHGGLLGAFVGACAPATPPPLTPNPDHQEVIVDSEPEPDPFEGNWESPAEGETQTPHADAQSKTNTEESESEAPAQNDDECRGSVNDPLMENLRKRGRDIARVASRHSYVEEQKQRVR